MTIHIESFVEVTLPRPDNFLIIKETLTRIGIASKRNDRQLFQSCHILHKRGKYYIVHFKELFALDGKPSDFNDEDLARRNTIANLLSDWGLAVLVEPDKSAEPVAPMNQVKVIKKGDASDWQLVPKYSIGKRIC